MSIFRKSFFKNTMIILGTTLGIFLSCLMCGAFTSSGGIEAITYAAESERKKDGTNFNYLEATASRSNMLFNDGVSSASLAFDNYWHFENRPNIYAFKKWDLSYDEMSQNYVYPLSFDYLVNEKSESFSIPIISTIANRWEGDFSHLELKTINEMKKEYIEELLKDEIAIQNSVIVSYSLASKMTLGNVESIVGTNINKNVFFTNSRYKQAHYNDNSNLPLIDEINIIGVFDEKSSSRMGIFVGNEFVFMFGGAYGTYNHSGIKIGCHLSSDNYANSIALTQFTCLDNDNSKVTFYNCKNGTLINGNMQNIYQKAKQIGNSNAFIVSIAFSATIASILIIVFVKKIVKLRQKKSIYLYIFFSLLFGLIILKLKSITFGSLCIPLLNSLGVSLWFIVSLVLFFSLIAKKNEMKLIINKYHPKESKSNFFIERVIPLFALITLIISIYTIMTFVVAKERYLLLPAGIAFVGSSICVLLNLPRISFKKIRIKNKVLHFAFSELLPFAACFALSIGIIITCSKFITIVDFSLKTVILTFFASVVIIICSSLLFFKNKKDVSQNANYNYQELDA